MNNGYIVIGAIALVLLLATFQVFANTQTTTTTDTSDKTGELTCGSCCGGNCGSCCANGVCSKSTRGTSSCGC